MTINIFHVVSNKYWGGPEEYAYEMVSKLRNDQRYYAEVVCKKNEPVLLHFRRLEIPISILPLKGMTDIDSPTRLARLLRKGHNIVHVHTFKDAFTAVMARRISENRNTRVIMTIHGIQIYTSCQRLYTTLLIQAQAPWDIVLFHRHCQFPTRRLVPGNISYQAIRLPLFPSTVIPPQPHRGYSHIPCILNDKLSRNQICPPFAILKDTPYILAFLTLQHMKTVICHDGKRSKQQKNTKRQSVPLHNRQE